MIVTVTPNPSLDRTVFIPALARGQLIRASSMSIEAGGKGINVSAALAAQNVSTMAVVPLSRSSAELFLALIGAATPIDVVTIAGPLRTNVSLVESTGVVTKVNEPGPNVSDDETENIVDRVAERGETADWVVGSGSLPPGMVIDFYARLAHRLRPGPRVAVDADGPALQASIESRPSLIKPNRNELEQVVGASLPTLGLVVKAARELVTRGVGSVLVSLGPDGAVYVDGGSAFHAEARLEKVTNTVGAGDALLAGFLAGGATGEALVEAVAWSVAACRSPGTRMGRIRPKDRQAVILHAATDMDRRLAA